MIGVYRAGQWLWKKIKGSITGEKIAGDLDDWNLLQQDINEALTASYDKLQARSMTLYHTYPPVASAVSKTTAYAIGGGNVFRSRPDHRILGITEDAAKEWGRKFQLLVHYYFDILNWYEKQSVLFRGSLIAGDSVLLFVRDEKGFDLIEYGGDKIDWDRSDDQNWTLGIKHDSKGRRSALSMGGKQVNFKNQKTGDQIAVQFYLKELPRQLRGMPLAYKIIALAKGHDREIDATIQRAVLEATMFGFSNTDTTDLASQIQQQVETAVKKRGGALQTAWQKISGSRKLDPGAFYQLKTGEGISFTDMKAPSSTFGLFQEWMIKYVAMGMDMTPGVIMSNYPTSYSSHRGEFNDFWKMVQQKRSFFNTKVNNVVVKELATLMILAGKISAPGFFDDPVIQKAWLSGSWLGPIPGHINPKQEIEAHAIAVKNAFETRGDVAAQFGNEYDNMINLWAEEEIQFKTLPLTEQEKKIQEGLSNV